jgi:hypothetical protein
MTTDPSSLPPAILVCRGSSDVVERLRSCMLQNVPAGQSAGTCSSLPYDAADVIEAQSATIERLSAENEALNDRLVETEMRAHQWMRAHDLLKAGKPYDFPSPADLPNALAELERAFREGWAKGYRAGVIDGGSDSSWCDEEGDWQNSETRAALSNTADTRA